jgi:hypothetical protein
MYLFVIFSTPELVTHRRIERFVKQFENRQCRNCLQSNELPWRVRRATTVEKILVLDWPDDCFSSAR